MALLYTNYNGAEKEISETSPFTIADVEFLFVCCEYIILPLINKEIALVYDSGE